MNTFVTLMITALLLTSSGSLLATQIGLDRLGNLEARFQAAVPVQEVSGMPLSATVSALPHDTYRISSPVPYRRSTLLHPFGTLLEANQPFVILEGPELHHFHEEYESARQQFALEQERYQQAKNLVDANAMDANTYLDIVKSRNSAELALKHYEHFFRWTSENPNAGEDALTLRTPTAGLLLPTSSTASETDYPIAVLLAPERIRLEVLVPARTVDNMHAIRLENCRVTMTTSPGYTKGMYRVQYSEPVGSECALAYGQTVSVTPLYKKTAWRIPNSAIFAYQDRFYIWRKQDQTIIATQVQPLAQTEQYYLVHSDYPLASAQVLITSVSAAHGILLGLGEE
jgi:hypothetical protein